VRRLLHSRRKVVAVVSYRRTPYNARIAAFQMLGVRLLLGPVGDDTTVVGAGDVDGRTTRVRTSCSYLAIGPPQQYVLERMTTFVTPQCA